MITVVGSAILFAIVSARLFGKEPSRMRSPMHGVQPPYRLPSNVVYFHDWRYVNCGAYAWAGRGGESVPMMGVGDVPAMEYRYVDMPLGVSLVAQRPTKTGPVF